MTEERRNDIGDRVVRLEELHNASTETVSRINGDLGALADDFAYFVDNVNSFIATSSKTNWNTLAAWGSVILALVAMPGAWLTSNLIRLEDDHELVFREYVIPHGKEIIRLQTDMEHEHRLAEEMVDSIKHLSRRFRFTEAPPKP